MGWHSYSQPHLPCSVQEKLLTLGTMCDKLARFIVVFVHTLLYVPQVHPALVSHVHHCEKQCNHHSLYHWSHVLTHVHTCGEGMAGTRLLELIASPLCKEHTIIIIIIIMFAAFITYFSSSLSSTPRLSSLRSHIGSSSNSSKSSTSISSASNNCITSRVHKRSSIVGGVQLLVKREFVQRNANKACGNRLWALANLRMTHNYAAAAVRVISRQELQLRCASQAIDRFSFVGPLPVQIPRLRLCAYRYGYLGVSEPSYRVRIRLVRT